MVFSTLSVLSALSALSELFCSFLMATRRWRFSVVGKLLRRVQGLGLVRPSASVELCHSVPSFVHSFGAHLHKRHPQTQVHRAKFPFPLYP